MKSDRKSISLSTPSLGTGTNSDALNPPLDRCPLNSYSPCFAPS